MHELGAKETKEKEQRVPPPSFELGTSPFGNIALPSARAEQQFLVHGTKIGTASLHNCRAPKEFRPATNAHHGNSALPTTRAGQHPDAPSTHATRAARTISCSALHKGRAASWKLLSHGLKIGLKIQFNSFLHQIKSPSKFQNPRIESV